MCIYQGIHDGYIVLELMEPCVELGFNTGDELRYKLTGCCIPNGDLIEGDIMNEGDLIMKKSASVKPDDTLSRIFTITRTKYAGELGAHLLNEESDCWSVNEGKISYKDGKVMIGKVEYELSENQLYFYPEGSYVNLAQPISSGIPNMKSLKDKNDQLRKGDNGILYSIFYYYIKSVGKFGKFNSEPFELLFKLIVDNDFNIDKAINNRPSLMNRLYYGGAIKQMQNAVTEAVMGITKNGEYHGGVEYRFNPKIADLISQDVVKASEISAKNKSTTAPTIRRISISKNFDGKGYDWKGLFKLMYNSFEDGDQEVFWDWQTVKDNLRQYMGKEVNDDGIFTAKLGLSIQQLRDRINETENFRENSQITELKLKISELEKQNEELNKKLKDLKKVGKTSPKTKSRLETNEYELDTYRIELDALLKKFDPKTTKEFWEKILVKATNQMKNIKNTDLANELDVWLTKGKYGSSLKPYVTIMKTKGIKLKVVLENYTEDEYEQIKEIETKIKELKDQQDVLDTSKKSQKATYNEIESEINDLTEEKRKLQNRTIPHIDISKDAIVSSLILNWRK